MSQISVTKARVLVVTGGGGTSGAAVTKGRVLVVVSDETQPFDLLPPTTSECCRRVCRTHRQKRTCR